MAVDDRAEDLEVVESAAVAAQQLPDVLVAD
jgi:hypothetical protein